MGVQVAALPVQVVLLGSEVSPDACLLAVDLHVAVDFERTLPLTLNHHSNVELSN